MSTKDDRLYWWALAATGREIGEMSLLTDSKVGKPGSPYSIGILKICSILKGAGKGIDPGPTYLLMRYATARLYVPEKESMRMWARAMRTAVPRYPADNDK